MEAASILDVAQTFVERGYVVAPSALDAATVASAREAFTVLEDMVGDLPADVVERWFVLDREDAEDETRPRVAASIFIAGDPPRFRPQLAAVVTDPLIVQLARHSLGTETIQYHFANITAKAPRGSRAISWHRDYPNQYMSPRRSRFVRVMVCLDGMDADNGGTQFVPGSHLITDEQAVENERGGFPAGQSDGPVETAACPPGSLVLIHPKVLHGGQPNRSGQPRRNIIVQWGPADEPVCLYADQESLTGLRATGNDADLRRELAQRGFGMAECAPPD